MSLGKGVEPSCENNGKATWAPRFMKGCRFTLEIVDEYNVTVVVCSAAVRCEKLLRLRLQLWTSPKSNTEKVEPNRADPYTEILDPKRQKERTLKLEPKCTKSNTLRLAPNLANDRRLMLEPTLCRSIVWGWSDFLSAWCFSLDELRTEHASCGWEKHLETFYTTHTSPSQPFQLGHDSGASASQEVLLVAIPYVTPNATICQWASLGARKAHWDSVWHMLWRGHTFHGNWSLHGIGWIKQINRNDSKSL